MLLELRGGNDGLNTIAPVSDPLYSQARPSIHLHPEEALPLKAGLGLHPALSPLLPLWQKQRLTFALGVGWNNQTVVTSKLLINGLLLRQVVTGQAG